GKTLTPADIQGKLVLVSFFFSRCSGICPMVMACVWCIYQRITDHSNLIFVSVSVDPERDRKLQLAEFRTRMLGKDGLPGKLPFKNWYFTTGDKTEIYALARGVFQADGLCATQKKANHAIWRIFYTLSRFIY
ncbi:MAG TPA: SCO family protein, partial [Turneriella sp.]|nr:SCO family protein [Turneriella sp.]